MTATKCPACGHTTAGRFCSNCGAGLPGKVTCAACGSEIPGGGRFCNQCGVPTAAAAVAAAVAAPAKRGNAPVVASASRNTSTLPWVVAGLAVLALVIVLVMPEPSPAPTGAAGGAPQASAPVAGTSQFGDASSVDLSAMTPRERADRLFNRVMQNISAGDTTQARFFLPMALAAYSEVPDLNADGHYHMAVLHLAGGDPSAARIQADSILAGAPTHLFGLFTAAQAEQALGNTAEAREFYGRFQEAFAAESALARGEYSEHQAVMALMKQEAAQMVGGQ